LNVKILKANFIAIRSIEDCLNFELRILLSTFFNPKSEHIISYLKSQQQRQSHEDKEQLQLGKDLGGSFLRTKVRGGIHFLGSRKERLSPSPVLY
jgi:hypothetical protein